MRLIHHYNQYARRSIAALAGVVALAVFLYGSLLLGAVAHAAGRTDAEKQLQKLQASVSALESQYLQETKAVTPERAASLGFVAPQESVVVYASAPSLVVR